MPDKSTSTRFRERYVIFAKRTSFHGFREVNDSKSWPHRVFWITIMLFCTCMLAFHVQIQVGQYLNGSTITKIAELTDQEPYPFPHIWIGFNDWLWLDMEKLVKYEITYEELQTAKSYLRLSDDLVYDSNSLTPAEAKKKFEQRLLSLNLSGVVDFFFFFSLTSLNSTESRPQFEMYDLFESSMFGLLDLGSVVKEQTYAKILKSTISLNHTEYVENAWKYFQFVKVGGDKNRSDLSARIRPPFLLNAQSDHEIALTPNSTYLIGIDSKVYRHTRDCRADVDFGPIYSETFCRFECEIGANISYKAFDPCLPNSASIHLDMTQSYRNGSLRLCQLGIYVNESIEMTETPTFRTLTAAEARSRDQQERECKKSCIRTCQRILTIWSSMNTHYKQSSNQYALEDTATISIYVPDRMSLIIFEEVEQYAWHDMVSDLGGLLGLWLGASMMSLFQVVHLCCWAEAKQKGL